MSTAKQLWLWSVLTATVVVALNAVFTHRVLPNRTIAKTSAAFAGHTDSVEVFIMGHSHSAYGINTAHIPGAFNLSIPGDAYDQTYFKLRELIEKSPRLHTVAVPISLISLCKDGSENLRHLHHWSTYATLEELQAATGLSKARLLIGIHFPMFGNGIEFGSLLRQGSKASLEWRGLDGTIEKPYPPASVDTKNFCIQEQTKRYFEQIVALTKKHGIKLVLIRFPHEPSYIEAVGTQFDVEGYYEYFADYAEASESITLLNYQNLYQDRSLFSDYTHLNTTGANLFSVYIRDFL